jgi:hypothetical protein
MKVISNREAETQALISTVAQHNHEVSQYTSIRMHIYLMDTNNVDFLINCYNHLHISLSGKRLMPIQI